MRGLAVDWRRSSSDWVTGGAGVGGVAVGLEIESLSERGEVSAVPVEESSSGGTSAGRAEGSRGSA